MSQPPTFPHPDILWWEANKYGKRVVRIGLTPSDTVIVSFQTMTARADSVVSSWEELLELLREVRTLPTEKFIPTAASKPAVVKDDDLGDFELKI